MNFKDKDAIYLQIADYVSEHITMGKWQPEEKIPSVRELAVALQVNPNTVMRTYEHLQQQDIIFNKRGLGLFVSVDAVARVRAIRKERFLQQELPGFFNSLFLLDIKPEELLKQYEDFKKTKS
ncbi:GntR family transcriptional regulator [Mucilaginibacter sp. UYCu711]|uniref:GntR family transcriptional regulator n=1 Tax=Mucilaginibacter sp. UYCu711 TaxID=3156339 RepID=UPI003D1E366A